MGFLSHSLKLLQSKQITFLVRLTPSKREYCKFWKLDIIFSKSKDETFLLHTNKSPGMKLKVVYVYLPHKIS